MARPLITIAPVCLNSLLYKTERDLEEMSRMLGREDRGRSVGKGWRRLAGSPYKSICGTSEQGLFFDYNFDNGQRSTYRYATTFYPLWAGLATDAQARAVVTNLGAIREAGRHRDECAGDRKVSGIILLAGRRSSCWPSRACVVMVTMRRRTASLRSFFRWCWRTSIATRRFARSTTS